MPRFPRYSARCDRVTGSVYEKFRARMASQGERLVGLHIGDAWPVPSYPIPLEAAFVASHPGFHRYCDTFGVAALRDALVEKLRHDNHLDVNRGNVLITAGATNALSAIVQSIVEEGDDVILLSPFWPFFRGMVAMAGGNPVEVPLYAELYGAPDIDVADRLERALTPRTAWATRWRRRT